VARFRVSQLAEADLAQILKTSAERWGADGQRRYAKLLAAAMRKLAADPQGPTTRSRNDLLPGIRSFHIHHARRGARSKVRSPVHVLYYRVEVTGVIEVVRVLHERMEPSRHLGSIADDAGRP
jgi:toxin ParE1/3/4